MDSWNFLSKMNTWKELLSRRVPAVKLRQKLKVKDIIIIIMSPSTMPFKSSWYYRGILKLLCGMSLLLSFQFQGPWSFVGAVSVPTSKWKCDQGLSSGSCSNFTNSMTAPVETEYNNSSLSECLRTAGEVVDFLKSHFRDFAECESVGSMNPYNSGSMTVTNLG